MSDDIANSVPPPPPPPPPPLPPPPLPAATQPAPIPVAALAYSTPMAHGRPGILTAVAVISIVIASLSAIASLGTGCQSLVFMQMRRTAPAMSATATSTVVSTPTPPPAAPPANGTGSDATTDNTDSGASVTQGPNGLDPGDRAVAIATLSSMQSLTPPQKHQLDIFLAEHGQDVFPTAGAKLTAGQVRAIVTSTSSDSSDGNAGFTTSRGTFGVYDDKVEFRRTGASDTITTGDAAAANNSSTSSNVWGLVPLKPAEVKQIIKILKQRPGITLTSAQSATLTQQLQSPSQQLVQSNGGSVSTAILNAQMLADGSVWVQFNSMSSLTINPQGQVTNSFSFASAGPTFSINPVVCMGLTLASLLSIGLAILLLVAAIQVMRQVPSGKRLHMIWAWLQMPIAIAGWLLCFWMYYQLQSGVINGMTPPGTASGFAYGYGASAVGAAVVACIYPIALLIVFRTRAMRAYYNVVQM